jgi:predicted ATPase
VASRIERLTIRNYRVLHDVDLHDLSPLTFLVGPNGTGKSTVLDVLAFLHEAVTEGLGTAWHRRGGLHGIRSLGHSGPVEIEVAYRSRGTADRLITYRVEIDERDGEPFVCRERLSADGYRRVPIDLVDGKGTVADMGDDESMPITVRPSVLLLAALGNVEGFGAVAHVKLDMESWHVSTLESRMLRSLPTNGAQPLLSPSGDNLANVVRYLEQERPDVLADLVGKLRGLVPQFDRLGAEVSQDNRLLLRIGELAFHEPVLARFASDGTLHLLAHHVVLGLAGHYGLVALEEPDGFLHPRLHYGLAEELRAAAEHTQVLVTTHSPHLVDGARPEDLWMLYRAEDGFARTVRASDVPRLRAMTEAGGLLGDLWMEGFIGVGDPLTREGRPRGQAGG